MRKIALLCLLMMVFFWMSIGPVQAKVTPTRQPTATIEPAATPTVVVKREGNLTEPSSKEVTYRLESVLEKNKSGRWNVINSLRKAEEFAVSKGVSANTIVLLLLLPLIATLVSVLHYILGLSGYGIFMPTMIAVAFLATGILGGLVLFALILAISLLSNLILKKFKLHFWPARSISLMLMAAGTFGLMVLSTYIKVLNISNISIFPVLFMILLAEDFVRTELAKSKNEAKKLMIGTLVLAITGAVMMDLRVFQEAVLLHPGVSLVTGLLINLAVGNYTGIRLSEVERFKKAIRIRTKPTRSN
jgi:hypothetical protein